MRNELEESVLARIRPGREEREHVAGVAEKILATARDIGQAESMIVGSVARDTWIHGDRDLDVFLLFDPSLTRQELEERGLCLAREIAERLGAPYHQKYAEHPYINATFDGLDVDLVPCFRVESAAAIRSSVDRTPFHTRYVSDRIGPYTDDVLLLKQFAKAGGVYGSDQMTEGFSGYLCELLVLFFGGFQPLLVAASGWKPGILIDPEQHRTRDFPEPLVVVDPVDPGRNVSAAVSLDRMFGFVELARGYLVSPSPLFFFTREPAALSRDDVGKILREKGTSLLGITLATPPYIADIVVPQLRRSLDSIRSLLERQGYCVFSAGCEMHEARSLLLFELESATVPAARRHFGPPVWNRQNAERFFAKYQGKDTPGLIAGPFIENGRYVVEVHRNCTDAGELLRSAEVLDVSLGKHIRISLQDGWEVARDEECWSAEFAPFITGFCTRESPMTGIWRRGTEDTLI